MKSNAQRQADYRYSRGEAGANGERRLNTWLRSEASFALKRLAQRHGMSQRALLERMLVDADEQVIATLDPNDDEQWSGYFDVTQ